MGNKSYDKKYGVGPRPKKTKPMCSGCRDNFYNGNNPYDISECWNFKGARVKCLKLVHINQVPPWTQKPQWILGCYRPPKYVRVGPDQEY